MKKRAPGTGARFFFYISFEIGSKNPYFVENQFFKNMKILKAILFVVLAIVILVVIIGVVAPKKFNVEVSTSINAPAPMVRRYIANLELQNQWSVWSAMDSTQVTTYSGELGTVGSRSSWVGEINGVGYQEVSAIDENTISMDLVFSDPFESTNKVTFSLNPDEQGVNVTWLMQGEMPFPFNAMMVFTDMGMSNDFGAGLKNLKTLTEQLAAEKTYLGYTVSSRVLEPVRMIGKRAVIQIPEISNVMAAGYGEIIKKYPNSTERGALYFEWNPEEGTSDMAVVMRFANDVNITGFEEFVLEGNALQIDYFGESSGSENAHYAMDMYFKDYGLEYKSPVWESYITDSSLEPDTSKWLTRITYFY